MFNVLVVEDDPVITNMMTRQVHELHLSIELTFADTAQGAWQLFQSSRQPGGQEYNAIVFDGQVRDGDTLGLIMDIHLERFPGLMFAIASDSNFRKRQVRFMPKGRGHSSEKTEVIEDLARELGFL